MQDISFSSQVLLCHDTLRPSQETTKPSSCPTPQSSIPTHLALHCILPASLPNTHSHVIAQSTQVSGCLPPRWCRALTRRSSNLNAVLIMLLVLQVLVLIANWGSQWRPPSCSPWVTYMLPLNVLPLCLLFREWNLSGVICALWVNLWNWFAEDVSDTEELGKLIPVWSCICRRCSR